MGRYDDIIRFTFTSSTHRPSAFTPGGWRPLNRRVRQGSEIQLKVQPRCFKSSAVDFQLFLHPFFVILCVLLSIYTPISRFKPFFSSFASLFSRSTYKILFVVVLSLLTSHCSHFAFLQQFCVSSWESPRVPLFVGRFVGDYEGIFMAAWIEDGSQPRIEKITSGVSPDKVYLFLQRCETGCYFTTFINFLGNHAGS